MLPASLRIIGEPRDLFNSTEFALQEPWKVGNQTEFLVLAIGRKSPFRHVQSTMMMATPAQREKLRLSREDLKPSFGSDLNLSGQPVWWSTIHWE